MPVEVPLGFPSGWMYPLSDQILLNPTSQVLSIGGLRALQISLLDRKRHNHDPPKIDHRSHSFAINVLCIRTFTIALFGGGSHA